MIYFCIYIYNFELPPLLYTYMHYIWRIYTIICSDLFILIRNNTHMQCCGSKDDTVTVIKELRRVLFYVEARCCWWHAKAPVIGLNDLERCSVRNLLVGIFHFGMDSNPSSTESEKNNMVKAAEKLPSSDVFQHIPPLEKENHLQKWFGKEYVTFQQTLPSSRDFCWNRC